MEIIETGIEGLIVLKPKIYGDERGFFFESYNESKYSKVLTDINFVQDNFSKSSRGVLRGLHYQVSKPQGKLVQVVSGEVFDVAVDLRKDSDTYGKWFGIKLSNQNKYQMFIPKGFAHGFLVLSESALFHYKCTDFYDPLDEAGVKWNDATINIQWPNLDDEFILSDKDKQWGNFK